MEPVELTVITRNKTKEGLDEIIRDTSKVGRTVEQVTADFKARMQEQSDVVKQVEADIKSLEKQLSKASPGKAKMELAADLEVAKKVLAEEKGELALLEKQVEQSAQKHIALRTEIRNLKEQMAGMKEGTEEYAAAMKKLGDMQDRMGDINTQGRIFSDDNKKIKATMDAVSGLAGAMTTGVGVASLFGVEQEKLAQIQTRLQAVMAITMGVQQVANTLNKDSYFTHVLLAGAKNMLTAATTRLAVSLGISNVAAQALMATLTLGLSAVITGLIVLWNNYSDRTKNAQKAVNDEIAKTNRALQQISADVDFDTRIAEVAGKSKKELIELRKEAAKTALALADASFDEVNMKFIKGDATKEQLDAARENSQKAWDNYNKTMQDAVVYDYEERTTKKKKGGSNGNRTELDEIADAELKARQKINDMTIALMKEGEKKKKELALKQFDDELARIDREERDRLKALQNAQKNGMAVTPEQVATVKDQAARQRNLAGEQYMEDYYAISKEYADKDKKLKEEEEQSWIDYNKEYGTYQEKRAAIAKDYGNKIAKAKPGGEKASLKKQMEDELKNLDFDNLKKEIDWTSVFGNLDKVSTDALGKLKKQLQSFISEQKNLSPENIKEIVQAINSIEQEERQRSPFQAISDSFASLTLANKDATEARKEYNKVLADGTEKEKADAKAKLDSAEAAKRKAQFNGMNDMLNMTGKQLEWIKTNYTGLWSVMDGDFRGYLDKIIEYGEAEIEIMESVKERLNGISFDSFKDSYLSLLSNIDSSNADFSENFEKHLRKSILNSLMEKNYASRIKALYDSWAKAGEDGVYTEREVASLRNMQQSLSDSMLEERNKLAEAMGWSSYSSGSSQSGRAGAVTTITEETAGKIEGIATSLQIHVISMDDKMTDISQYAYEAIGILNTIAENTAFCKYLEDIAEAIEKMERDGVKMK